MIKEVKVLTHLKAGKMEWEKGAILKQPIPHDILLEIKHKTGTVEVLLEEPDFVSREPPPDNVVTFVTGVKTNNKPKEEPVKEESTFRKPFPKRKAKTSRRKRR